MNDTTTFADMARELGLPKKLLYSVKEVSRVLGVTCSTVYDEMKAGRLRYHLPPGESTAACEARMGGRLDRGRYT